MTEDKIIDLIRKLLNLSRSPNEHEASLALKKAQKLLFEHNLSISQVNAATNLSQQTESVIEESVHIASRHQFKEWKISLGFGIAQYFFCKGLVSRTGHYFYFIGKKSDTEVITEAYKWIIEQAERLADEALVAYKKTDDYNKRPIHGRQFKNSYFRGLVTGICNILRDQWNKLENESEQSRALVVVRGKEVTDFIAQKYPKLRNHQGSNSDLDYHAYSKGKADASKVHIGPQSKQVGTQDLLH
jgi:hypothetical protein